MKHITKLLMKALLCVFILFNLCQGGGLNPDWKKGIVLIEKVKKTGEGKDRLVAHGTGCIVWHYGEPEKGILLTNKHIFTGRDSVLLRFNKKPEYIDDDSIGFIRQVLYLRQVGHNLWTAHPDSQVDLAGIPIQVDTLADVIIYPFSLFKPVWTVNEGDEILFLGFPLGLTGTRRNYPIVREGIVALKTDEGVEGKDVFLIDALVFRGNSGSPVFLKPVPVVGEDTVRVGIAYFIGIITAYLEVPKKGSSGVELTENSGLGMVVRAERVAELLEFLWGKTIEEVIRGN